MKSDQLGRNRKKGNQIKLGASMTFFWRWNTGTVENHQLFFSLSLFSLSLSPIYLALHSLLFLQIYYLSRFLLILCVCVVPICMCYKNCVCDECVHDFVCVWSTVRYVNGLPVSKCGCGLWISSPCVYNSMYIYDDSPHFVSGGPSFILFLSTLLKSKTKTWREGLRVDGVGVMCPNLTGRVVN